MNVFAAVISKFWIRGYESKITRSVVGILVYYFS